MAIKVKKEDIQFENELADKLKELGLEIEFPDLESQNEEIEEETDNE